MKVKRFLILVKNNPVLRYEKFEFNLIYCFCDNKFLIKFNMQISVCWMCIRFWSKTFKLFLYKFQDMHNNLKYGFHDK